MARQRPMQLDDLFQLKAVGKVAMSPDGQRVAFELKRFDPKENKNFTQIMLADAEGEPVRSLTAGRFNYVLPKWSPDGRFLAFLSDREKGMCLYVLPMKGGEALRITDKDGFVRDFAWSPDSRRLAYTYQPMSEREELERDGKQDELRKRPQFKHITRLHHKLDGAGWWNGQYTHVWIINRDGEKARQLTRGDYDDGEPRFSPDGRLVSFVSNRVENPDLYLENQDLYVVRPTGGAIRKLSRTPGGCAGHSWSPDGRWIAYIGNAAKPGQWWKHLDRVWLMPASGGPASELTREIDNHCRNLTLGDVTSAGFEVAPVIWSTEGGRVYFLVAERGATRLYSRSVHKRGLRCEVGGDVNVLHVQRTTADGPLALSMGTATSPGDVYLYDPERGPAGAKATDSALRRLSDVNGAVVARIHINQPVELEIRSDGGQVHTWVMRPPGFNARRKYPVILQIHGGPHAQFGCGFFHEMQLMAARGYVVVLSNPRGSAGYGMAFQKSIHADWGNLDYRDLMHVADWIFSRPFVDRKRVGVTGGSYGGYMTNWLVGHTSRFRAAVTQRSLANMESLFGTSDFGYDLGHEFGGSPWEKVQQYRQQSPLTYVRNIRTPLLIEHEEEDHRCPIEQAEQFFTSLKVLGRVVELVRFEGESHGLCRGGRPQNRAERLRRILGWFDKYMK